MMIRSAGRDNNNNVLIRLPRRSPTTATATAVLSRAVTADRTAVHARLNDDRRLTRKHAAREIVTHATSIIV